jgi:hypothetical protein
MPEVRTSNRNTPASPVPPTPPSSESTQSASVNKLLTNKHSDPEYHEFLEHRTDIVGFRLPARYVYLYSKLSKKEKKLLKQALMGLIEALARGGGQVVAQTVEQSQQTVVLNLNLNVQQQSVDIGGDGILEERVRLLEKRLRQAQELLNYYKDVVRRVKLAAQQNDMRTIRQVLSRVE